MADKTDSATGYTVDVYLYPNPGAGIQMMRTPQGDIPMPIPFNQYRNCLNVETDTDGVITFDKPDGTRVESNVPYVVVRTPKSASEE